MDQNTHRPERSDSPGDRAHVYHVAGDVAEEEGQARAPLHGAGEADLLAGLTVVVADGRDGKAARVGWPRGVNGDAVGLAAPADEAQTLAHKVTLGALAAKPWGRGASRRGGRHQSSTWRLARPASTQDASCVQQALATGIPSPTDRSSRLRRPPLHASPTMIDPVGRTGSPRLPREGKT